MSFSGGTRVESVGTLRPSNGAGHRVGGPKRVMIFFPCICLKNSESDAELKGFYVDVDSLVIKLSQVNKAPMIDYQICWAHGWINPNRSSPCHIENDPH